MVNIIAHRGARSIAPENTIAAAQKAFETGADLWETDVSVTRDGHLILFHDVSLERTTDVETCFPQRPSFDVADYSLQEIWTLSPGLKYAQQDPFSQIRLGKVTPTDLNAFRREKIPTLEQGLLFTKEKNWRINIEMKSHPLDLKNDSLPGRVIKAVKRIHIGLDQVILSSFNHEWLYQARALEPKINIQALVGETLDQPLDFKDYSFQTYNIWEALADDSVIRQLKNRGKTVNIFTVNEKSRVSRFVDLGVDGIFTDFPQVFATHGR